MLKWLVWTPAVSKDGPEIGQAERDTYVAHIDARDAGPSVVSHALDHLVENLTRVRLGPQRHLQPVHPALGVLARGALDGHVGAATPAELLELAHHRLLVGHAKAELLKVDELKLVLLSSRPAARDKAQTGFRVDKNDLVCAFVERIQSGHLADGAGAKDGDIIAGVDGRVLDCVVRRGQDIRQPQGY